MTTESPDMALQHYDVAVVGAGPAGAATALLAARGGCRVLLVEKAPWPRYKVCGCCLNMRALAVLERIGLLPHILALQGVLLREFCVHAGGRKAEVPLPGGLAVARSRFDDALVEAAIVAGVDFSANTTASLTAKDGSRRFLTLECDESATEVTARYVVAADGLGSRLLRAESWYRADPVAGSRIGGGTLLDSAPEGYKAGTIYMACSDGGYVGMEVVDGGRLVVAGAFDAAYVKSCGGLAEASQRILAESGQGSIPGLADAAWKGTPALTRKASCVAADAVFAIGDATGYVEPFTGEGMAWALASAEKLGPMLADAVHGENADVEIEWNRMHGQIVRNRQWLCKSLAAGLRRPQLVAGVVGLVGWLPALAAPIVAHLNDGNIMQGM